MEPIFDGPMRPNQRQYLGWRRVPHGETTQPIDDFVAKPIGGEQADGAFEPEDLLNALPLLAKPVVQVRTTHDLTMLQPSMRFVPGFRCLPASPVRGRVSEEIGDIRAQRGLIVFGDQQIVSPQLMDLSAQVPLGVHRIQGQDTARDVVARQERFERANLILLLPDIAMPQDDACRHLITRQLMDGMGLGNGRPQGFAIQGQVPMIGVGGFGLQPAGFRATAALGLPAHEKRPQQRIEVLPIDPG